MASHSADDNLFVDEEEDDRDYYEVDDEGRKECVIFLVDVGRDMFLETEGSSKTTYFDTVMQAIEKDLRTRVFLRDADEVGICFFNSKERKNLLEAEGVYEFKSMAGLKASDIKNVLNVKDHFQKDIGSIGNTTSGSRDNALYNALWVAQGMLSKSSTKNSEKRILLFTNNDDPFGDINGISKLDMIRTTIQRAKDAQDLGISLDLYAISRPGEEFNVNIFYKEMLQMGDEEAGSFMARVENRFDELVSRMRKKLFKKRTVRRITLTVVPGMNIGLGTFAMIRPSAPGKAEWLDSSTNVPVKAERSYICTDTGAIMNEPLKRFLDYNNKKVIFTRDEISQVKTITSVQLQFLGFKPLHCLKDYHNLRPGTFLYPDEEAINGSTCAFIALHSAMLELQRYAVAFYGKSASPQMVALVPQEEITNESGQLQPPGMHMIYLPYAEDIRPAEKFHSNPKAPVERATSEQIDNAIAMVRRLELKDFSVYSIENPALQTHYSILQAVALDEDMPKIQDTSLPDEEGMKKPKVVEAVQAFKDAVYGPTHDAKEAEAEAQRAKGSVTAQKRKAAAEVASKEAEGYDWNELADSGKLKNLTVVELKYYLMDKKLPLTGKKEVLINRILTHMGK